MIGTDCFFSFDKQASVGFNLWDDESIEIKKKTFFNSLFPQIFLLVLQQSNEWLCMVVTLATNNDCFSAQRQQAETLEQRVHEVDWQCEDPLLGSAWFSTGGCVFLQMAQGEDKEAQFYLFINLKNKKNFLSGHCENL